MNHTVHHECTFDSHRDSTHVDEPVGGLRKSLSNVIRFYQRRISPLFPPSCRFYPTCSEYARQAIVRHGAVKGIWLGIVRLSKCHPFHRGGVDLVP